MFAYVPNPQVRRRVEELEYAMLLQGTPLRLIVGSCHAYYGVARLIRLVAWNTTEKLGYAGRYFVSRQHQNA